MEQQLIKVRNLVKHFPIRGGVFGRVKANVHAVDGVDLDILRSQTLGLVGESGCGKSTLGRAILKLIQPDGGEIDFDGTDLMTLSGSALRSFRRKMQIIFQDPYASLNPRMTVGDIVGEPLLVHKIVSKKERRERVLELLSLVGLKSAYARNYPHEFSGGQRQRIGIARAIALHPTFIVADEPVSALDVSIQGEIINLLMDLQEKFGLSYLFIAHDLKVVVQMSNEINVMYLGLIVEKFKGDKLADVKHPYTQALVSAVPVADTRSHQKRIVLKGDVPSPVEPPVGCRFHPRCSYMKQRCKEEVPKLREIGTNHLVACHFAESIPQMA
jgi:oligopeptide/dipeptide ABC transporter ATP-binding protein